MAEVTITGEWQLLHQTPQSMYHPWFSEEPPPAFSGSQLPRHLLSWWHLLSSYSEPTAEAAPGLRGQAGKKSISVPKWGDESHCSNFVSPLSHITSHHMWETRCWEGRWREHSSGFHLLPHKHHPCCCLCLSTPGTKAPIRLIILPLRMFPLRGSLGLAAWQQAPREPGGHLLLQCQCYFQGFRLTAKKLLNSP